MAESWSKNGESGGFAAAIEKRQESYDLRAFHARFMRERVNVGNPASSNVPLTFHNKMSELFEAESGETITRKM